MKSLKIKTKNGFSILAVILVIVAVIVAIGVWALSGSTNTSASGTASNSVVASSIINDSGAIKLAFDTIVINGENADNIIVMPGGANPLNILDPVNGISMPKTSAKAFKEGATEPNGIWVYNKNVAVVGVGKSGTYDYAITLAGVKDSVCKSINFNLYGSDTIPVFGPMNASEMFVVGATASNPNTTTQLDFQSGGLSISALGWTVGCVASNANPDNNLFFRILKAN